MEAQIKILNELAGMLHFSTNVEYDLAFLEYKFNLNEGWDSITIWCEKEGENIPPKFNADKKLINELCQKLHANMQAQTGG
ncbi:hypothetical protein FHQ30_13070, partial [Pasteurellaceae bacterium Phil11]